MWAYIKKAINSNLNKTLDRLIDERLNTVDSNLSSIKSTANTINTKLDKKLGATDIGEWLTFTGGVTQEGHGNNIVYTYTGNITIPAGEVKQLLCLEFPIFSVDLPNNSVYSPTFTEKNIKFSLNSGPEQTRPISATTFNDARVDNDGGDGYVYQPSPNRYPFGTGTTIKTEVIAPIKNNVTTSELRSAAYRMWYQDFRFKGNMVIKITYTKTRFNISSLFNNFQGKAYILTQQ